MFRKKLYQENCIPDVKDICTYEGHCGHISKTWCCHCKKVEEVYSKAVSNWKNKIQNKVLEK